MGLCDAVGTRGTDTSRWIRVLRLSLRVPPLLLNEKTRSELCLELLPAINSQTVELRDNQRLVSQLLIPAEYSVVFGHSECLAGAGAARCAPTLYFANINKPLVLKGIGRFLLDV